MKITFLPKSKIGLWALILAIVSPILFVIGSVIPSKSGYSGMEIVTQNPIHGILTLLMFAAALTSLILALISIIKKEERSILVFLVLPFGLYGLISFIGVIVNLFTA